jgi:hypothetical protein
MSKQNHYPAFRSLTMLTVAKLDIAEGLGVKGDPVRIVTYYVDPETSRVLARVDAFENDQPAPAAGPGRATED